MRVPPRSHPKAEYKQARRADASNESRMAGNDPQNEMPQERRQQREEKKRERPAAKVQEPRKKDIYFSFQMINEMVDEEDIQQVKKKLLGLYGSLIERINGTRMDQDVPLLMVMLLNRLVKDKSSEISIGLINQFVESDFFEKLTDFFKVMATDVTIQLDMRIQVVEASTQAMSAIMDMFESRFAQFSDLIGAILVESNNLKMKLKIQKRLRESQRLENVTSELMLKYYQLIEDVTNEKKKEAEEEKRQKEARKKRLQSEKPGYNQYKVLPVKDFQLVEIVPGELELTGPDPLIRRMPEEGNLVSKHNYLDLLFQLLNYDAIHDLRKSIQFVQKNQQIQRNQLRWQLKEVSGARLYEQITIQNLDVIDGCRCIQFRMIMDKKRYVDWRISKKLMGGSLVVLSHDQFQTLFIGLLKNSDYYQRNETHINYGYISVNIEILKSTEQDGLGGSAELEDLFMRFQKCTFMMMESAAYFESYRHVLRQLQIMDDWDQLPMERYLVHGRTGIHQDASKRPSYMNKLIRDNYEEINLMVQEMNLDKTQLEAFIHVLDHELSLIQGPPGTGKTYIGIKIVKFLLKYRHYWQRKGPILLVCQTNHALHQFLHQVKLLTDKIIKIGGKQEEGLEHFGLFDQLKDIEKGPEFGKTYREMKIAQEKIVSLQQEGSKYEFKVINSLITEQENEENEDVAMILNKLKQQFQAYLKQHLLAIQPNDLRDIIDKNFTRLCEITNGNIVVLIWLGIIDVKKIIKKMLREEDAKQQVRNLENQIQLTNDQIKKTQRTLDKLYQDRAQSEKIIKNLLNKKKKGGKKSQGQPEEIKGLETEQNICQSLSDQIAQELQKQKALGDKIGQLKNQLLPLQKQPDVSNNDANQVDNNDVIESDQRELDFENVTFIKNNSVDNLLDVLNGIYTPEIARDFFSNCQNVLECVSEASKYKFDTDRQFKKTVNVIKMSKDLFDYQVISFEQRWALNNEIISQLIESRHENLDHFIKKYQSLWKQQRELQDIYAVPLLKKQDIVAMTTTGRAKYADLLQTINFPIVIVEEAAEVFEAHIMTSLSHKTSHVILIGDHEQLRPSPAVHTLDIQYNLSLSMFERLIKNKMEHSTLATQRRMRPEISKVMKFIYPKLQNHEDVRNFPDVKGIAKNLFFFNHEWKEESNDQMTSKANTKEAEMIVRFAWYILQQQQYSWKQLTILTLYSGQLLKIKALIKNNKVYQEKMREIKVVNVDNYQGEENEVILLSLVRSNDFGQIGFLKTSNRVCVALSRAKHGLYIFGNSKCLIGQRKLELWSQVIQHLKDNQFYGDALPLKCQNHEDIYLVKSLDDFARVPVGGCGKICAMKMECGHACDLICHPVHKTTEDPTGHKSSVCKQPCKRPLDCGHACTKKCLECKTQNQICEIMINLKFSACGHIWKVPIPCHQRKSKFNCEMPCERLLVCGHPCKAKCGETCLFQRCQENVIKRIKCGHTFNMICYQDPNIIICKEKVNKRLRCGHTLVMECCQDINTIKCIEKVNRKFNCGHIIQMECFQDINTFKCIEKVNRKINCGHSILMECYKNPITAKCNSICAQPLSCGHPCPKMCLDCQTSGQHGSCTQKCSRTLICGHECGVACIKSCASCEQFCQTSCHHAKCSLKCGQACQTCKEPCINQCPHSQCTRFCYHPCNKKLCNMPCEKKLICDHPCMGLCGAPCPPVCIVCNPSYDYFISMFEEEDSTQNRFILLENCNHVFEVSGLDTWMSPQAESQHVPTTVGFKSCPKCKTPITKCRRYTPQINQTLIDINAIKQLILDKEGQFDEQVKIVDEEFHKLKSKLASYDTYTYAGYLKQCSEANNNTQKLFDLAKQSREAGRVNEAIKQIIFVSQLFTLAKVHLHFSHKFTANQLKTMHQFFQDAKNLSQHQAPLHRERCAELVHEVSTSLNLKDDTSLKIEDIGVPRGQWIKCPVGHYYVIPAGGNAATSICQDCQMVIGGINHQLVWGSQHAGEIGGRNAMDSDGLNGRILRGQVKFCRNQ